MISVHAWYGIISALYANGYQNDDPTKLRSIYTTSKILLKANQYTFLTFFGIRFKLVYFKLGICNYNSEYYAVYNVKPTQTEPLQYTFNIGSPDFSCPLFTKSCISTTRAVSCNPPYVNYGYYCTSSCGSGRFPATQQICVDFSSYSTCYFPEVETSDNELTYTIHCAFDRTSPTIRMLLPGPFIQQKHEQIILSAIDVLSRALVSTISLNSSTHFRETLPLNVFQTGSYSLAFFWLYLLL